MPKFAPKLVSLVLCFWVAAIATGCGDSKSNPPRPPDAGQATDANVTSDTKAGGDSLQPISGTPAFIVIHADPGTADATNWTRLTDLIARADTQDHKITILMGADWGTFTMADSARKNTVLGWINGGHQIGFHHHDCTHAEFDGYHDMNPGSSDPDMQAGSQECKKKLQGGGQYKGSVATAFLEVKAIASDFLFASTALGGAGLARTNQNDILVAAQGGNKSLNNIFRENEWQEGVVYATGHTKDNQGIEKTTLSKPTCHTYKGIALRGELGHTQLNIGNFRDSPVSVSTTQIEQDIADAAADQVIGIVFHAHEYVNEGGNSDKTTVDQVLDLLTSNGITSSLVTSIIDQKGCS